MQLGAVALLGQLGFGLQRGQLGLGRGQALLLLPFEQQQLRLLLQRLRFGFHGCLGLGLAQLQQRFGLGLAQLQHGLALGLAHRDAFFQGQSLARQRFFAL